MSAAPQAFTLSNDEKINLLEELHRPLEEHWSVKTKFGLDAKQSEYIYKHHITRLEDIYTNHKTQHQPSPGLLYMSPVSQLYGINGLNVDDNTEKQKKKEQRWVSNFQKYAFLSDVGDHQDGDRHKVSKSNSYSPGKEKLSGGIGSSANVSRNSKRDGETGDKDYKRSVRSKCVDPNVSAEDLLMMGMYRLNEEQEEIYRRFVEMVSTFDDFDKGNIISDVMKDAHEEEDLLEGYGGTELPPAPAAPTQSGHPSNTHAGTATQTSTFGASQPLIPPHSSTVRSGRDVRPNSANGRRQ